eukprot:COSAG01_NODE_663_length_14420_cov_77.011382_13_plen_578_part_00
MATTGAAPRGRLVALCQHLTLPVGSVDGGATAAESSSGGRVEVPTHCGPVRGIDRGATHAFFGIPYATAERWRAPRTPPAPWSGVRDASKIGAACPQSVPHPVPGFAASGPQDEESCLNLNIFCPCPSPLTTGPAPSAAAAAPVLLWIHGGGFTHGAAYEPLYDGGVLAAQGAVVVSANWRLGALGFGFLGELGDQYSANNGLLDIIAALTWIRDNISQFGGDPQCVTVFGESAGAFAVFSLLAMPTAVGLFHRAICQSGGGSALQPTAEMGAAGMRQLLSLVEPGEGGAASSLEYLLDCPVEEIIAAQGKMAGLSGNIFAPTVEARTMPRQPLGAIAAGSAKGVPLLLGTNRDEPKLFVAARGRPELDEGSLLVRVQACLGLPRDENGAQRAAAVVEAFREARGVAGRATPGTPKNVDLCDAIGAEMCVVASPQLLHPPSGGPARVRQRAACTASRRAHTILAVPSLGQMGSHAAAAAAAASARACDVRVCVRVQVARFLPQPRAGTGCARPDLRLPLQLRVPGDEGLAGRGTRARDPLRVRHVQQRGGGPQRSGGRAGRGASPQDLPLRRLRPCA